MNMCIKILKGKDVENSFRYIKFLKQQTIFKNSLPIEEYTSAIKKDSLDFIMGLFNRKNELFGMVLYKFTGSEVDLREIVVLNTFHCRGLGSLLLKEFIKEIFEYYRSTNNLSLKYIVLQVESSNQRLKSFYVRHGFRTIAYRFPHPNWIKHDLMELDIEPIRE